MIAVDRESDSQGKSSKTEQNEAARQRKTRELKKEDMAASSQACKHRPKAAKLETMQEQREIGLFIKKTVNCRQFLDDAESFFAPSVHLC